MTLKSYFRMLLIANWRLMTTRRNGRILTITAFFLMTFIGVSAIFVDSPDSAAERQLNVTTITGSFIQRAEEALPDMDPITIEILRSTVSNIAASPDKAKRSAFRTFANGDRSAAIAALNTVAATQLEDGKTGDAVRTLKEVGALSFLVDRDISIRAYETALANAPQDAAIRNQLGLLYNQAGRGQDAAYQFRTILETAALKGTAWEASATANLGILAMQQGDLQQAEYFVIQSLQLNEKLGRQKSIGLQHANLGLIALSRGREEATESNFTKALAIFETLEETENVAAVLGSLGMFESMRKNQDAALEYLTRSYALYESLGKKEGMAAQTGALAILERTRGNRDQAEDWYKQSATLNQELGRIQPLAAQYAGLGGIELERNNIAGACVYWREAYTLFDRAGPANSRDQLENWLEAAKCNSSAQ